jgi:UDP-N-acetylmuramyl pentapeptide synthase
MKRFGFHILRIYLGFCAWIVLKRFKPLIIGIAGTTNKTFTKEALIVMLDAEGIASASSAHSFNTDIGIALSILDLPSGHNSYSKWFSIIPQVLIKVWTRVLPPVLILELGISHPGDTKHITHLVKPNVLIITDITQRYRENFNDTKTLSKEYAFLLKKLPRTGLAIINYDTMLVRDLAQFSKAPVFYFSLTDQEQITHNTFSASNIQTNINGIQAMIHTPQQNQIITISRFGRHHVASYLVSEIIKDSMPRLFNL